MELFIKVYPYFLSDYLKWLLSWHSFSHFDKSKRKESLLTTQAKTPLFHSIKNAFITKNILKFVRHLKSGLKVLWNRSTIGIKTIQQWIHNGFKLIDFVLHYVLLLMFKLDRNCIKFSRRRRIRPLIHTVDDKIIPFPVDDKIIPF